MRSVVVVLLAGVVAALVGDSALASSTDPFVEQAKLTAPSGSPGIGGGLLGASVALASDGNTALVGAPYDSGRAGAAWVFVRKGSTWSEQHKLTAPSSGAGKEIGHGQFGASVALGPSGNTALVGAPLDNGNVGAVWIFTRKGKKWTEREKLTVAKSPGKEIGKGEFGTSVALSSNGGVALVGAPFDHNVGAAWAFQHQKGTWGRQRKLTAPGHGADRELNVGGGGELGSSVALSSSGTTALVGGFRDNGYVGGAWVFIQPRGGFIWSEQRKLTAPTTGPGKEIGQAYFGFGAALSPNGNTAFVGGPNDGMNAGAAWAFTRSGHTWIEQQKLTAPATGGDREMGNGSFGSSVSLASNTSTGSIALIGGIGDNGGTGAAWEFTFQPAFLAQPSMWSDAQKLTAPATGADKEIGSGGFGWSVSLSRHTPATALIGAADDNANVGAAWVFQSQQLPPPR